MIGVIEIDVPVLDHWINVLVVQEMERRLLLFRASGAQLEFFL